MEENCCTPEGQIKRYVDCIGCDRKPREKINEVKQQTAVQWLALEINRRGPIDNNPPVWLQELYEAAIQMEKKQIMKAVYDSMGTNFDPNMGRAEKYYNETYGNEKR
jgi:hypothetical protein